MFNKLTARFPIIEQLVRFVVVGVINTGIDFLILNIEMFLTGITSGSGMLIQNAVSFGLATINSYYLNKSWTFGDKDKKKEGIKFAQFLTVSIIGITINSLIVYLITSFVPPMFGISPQLWANVAKLAATVISLMWNFMGYKFIVFKK